MSSYDGKLVMMANQIGKFYAPQKQVEPAAALGAMPHRPPGGSSKAGHAH